VPEARDLEISHAWSCFRPKFDDDLPVVDALPGASNAYVAAGMFSTGVLMAPAVGGLIAQWITEGHPPAGVAPFALARDALSRQAAQDPVPTGDVRPRASSTRDTTSPDVSA
jgi:glycine/D-amino acid oxidase-like deaminating enzyme